MKNVIYVSGHMQVNITLDDFDKANISFKISQL